MKEALFGVSFFYANYFYKGGINLKDLIISLNNLDEITELSMEKIKNYMVENNSPQHENIIAVIDSETVFESLHRMELFDENERFSILLEDFDTIEERNGFNFDGFEAITDDFYILSRQGFISRLNTVAELLDQSSGIGMGSYLMVYNNLKKIPEEVVEDEFF